MRIIKARQYKKEKSNEPEQSLQNTEDLSQQQSLTKDLANNIDLIKKQMGYAKDILVREFTLPAGTDVKAAIIILMGMSDVEMVNEQILGSLMTDEKLKNSKNVPDLFEQIKQKSMPAINVKENTNIENTVNELITGNSILLLAGIEKTLIIGSQSFKERQVSEPITENVIRGPRDGFTENIDNNIALIRRRIKSSNLRIESIKTGTQTKTDISMVYLMGVADDKVLTEVRNRLNRIDINGILESGYVEELIEDNPFSPFPLMEHSERPDKVSAAILEGRVAIMVDTTPFVLLVPTVFFQFLQSADDYYERFMIVSMTRIVRITAYFISVVLPALYIALTSYHQEMIPTTLALSLAASREGVPFPSIGEVLIMEVIFEIMREAGLRLPQQTGQAVSIVGGLVIGQAAVQAGIISQAMVIIVALTGISSFAIPAFDAAGTGRLLRIPLVLLASVLGLPGILAGLSVILIHMNSMRSFGVNYMEPFTTGENTMAKDTLIRNPWWSMTQIPKIITGKTLTRVRPGMKPGPGNTTNNKSTTSAGAASDENSDKS